LDAATRSTQSISRRKRQTSRVAASSTPKASRTRIVFFERDGRPVGYALYRLHQDGTKLSD
jgi:hypothetical protein